MRFKLTLQINRNAFGNALPINYQYELSALIYSVIARGDQAYAHWLHNNGFVEKHRNFKLFVFSNLYSPDIKREDDRLCLTSDYASFYLSFLPERSTEEFVKGIFSEQEFTLGDRKSKVQFRVQQIEMIASPVFSDQMTFKTLSPVVISHRQSDGRISYISPEDSYYGDCLVSNLLEKYTAFFGKEFTGDPGFQFKLLSPVRSRLILIKANTKEETKVRGFNYSFMLKTDPELLKIMYESGAGEKGSLGFGFVEVIRI